MKPLIIIAISISLFVVAISFRNYWNATKIDRKLRKIQRRHEAESRERIEAQEQRMFKR